ncbi:hypothetical protein HDC33_000599 [Sporosarcina sp. JAI121]|nr:hypothetical protein [Sporosarcina sp. JAI121]
MRVRLGMLGDSHHYKSDTILTITQEYLIQLSGEVFLGYFV